MHLYRTTAFNLKLKGYVKSNWGLCRPLRIWPLSVITAASSAVAVLSFLPTARALTASITCSTASECLRLDLKTNKMQFSTTLTAGNTVSASP